MLVHALEYAAGHGLVVWVIVRALTAALPATRARSAVYAVLAASATTITVLVTRF
jgi:hypothetical protein